MLNPLCQSARDRVQADSDLDDDAHVSGCEACQLWLEESLQQPPAGQPPDPPEIKRLEATLAVQGTLRSRLASLPNALRLRLFALALLTLVTVQLGFFARADLGVYPLWRLVLELGAHVLVLAALLAILMRPLFRPAWPLGLSVRAALLSVVATLAIAFTNPAHALHPASLAGRGADFWSRAGACLLYGTASGLCVVVLAALVHRGSPVGNTRSLGLHLLLTGLGVATGSLSLLLHCPVVHREHLLAGHVLLALPMAAVCAFVVWLMRGERTLPSPLGPSSRTPREGAL